MTLGTAGALATALRPLSAVAAAGEKSAADHGEFPESVFKQMNLRRIRVEIGLDKAFSVVQASDSHITYVSAEDFEKLDDKTMEWYISRSRIFAGGIPGLAAAFPSARGFVTASSITTSPMTSLSCSAVIPPGLSSLGTSGARVMTVDSTPT